VSIDVMVSSMFHSVHFARITLDPKRIVRFGKIISFVYKFIYRPGLGISA